MIDPSNHRRTIALALSLSFLAGCGQREKKSVPANLEANAGDNEATLAPSRTANDSAVAIAADAAPKSTPIDDVQTIAFPAGGTAVTLAGALSAAGDKRYRFDASAGQPARITLREPNAALAFNLYAPGSGPGGEALFRGSRDGARYAGSLPSSGSYTVQIYRTDATAGPARADYRLSVSIERAGADAGLTGASGSSADDPKGAIATYYRALDRGDYRVAYDQWEGDGEASGKSFASFRDGFANTRSTSVDIGTPRDGEGAAGSVYITVPVDVRATLRSGAQQHFAGSYVLRRINNVPGSSAEDRRWHLHSASLKPVR